MCNHCSLMKTLNRLKLLICRGQTAAEESVCGKQIVIHIHTCVLRNCLHDFMDFEKVSVDTVHSKYNVRILTSTFTEILRNRCFYLHIWWIYGYICKKTHWILPGFLHKLNNHNNRQTQCAQSLEMCWIVFVMINNFSPAA